MPDGLSYRRTHSLLLLQKLLAPKPAASPFTLLLDSLEQSSGPLVREFIVRAKANKTTVVFLGFDTSSQPLGVDVFIRGRRKDAQSLQKEITTATPKDQPTLLIIDTLHPLISLSSRPSSPPLPSLLTSLSSPTTSLLATYHTDIPLPSTPSNANPYAPSTSTLLKYLATTLITLHAIPHALATHRAALRSLPAPSFGLDEGTEGILVGLGANGGARGFAAASAGLDVPIGAADGIVLELEHRRKSGRGVGEMFFLPVPKPGAAGTGAGAKMQPPAKVVLLDDHPLFKPPERGGEVDPVKEAMTFNLGLTEKQRRDREGVVLPYFDAQRGGDGPGEGGRILYQMGLEDAGDWDSEEDEL